MSVQECLLTPSTVSPFVAFLPSVIVMIDIAIMAAASDSVTTRSCGYSSLMFFTYLHHFEEKCITILYMILRIYPAHLSS